tara:strand:- start:5 stop:553 length:549 start_codon:yes stop_codon:yes gene_type:complete
MAAQAAGIGESTLYKWISDDQGLREDLQRAESEALDHSLQVVRDAATAGDWKAAAWFLERKSPEDWGRNRRTKPAAPTKEEQDEINDPPALTMEVMGATWIRSLQVAEREYAAGQLSASEYLRAVTSLSGLAGRAMEIASRQADMAEVPALEVSVSLDSPHMIESPTPSEAPGPCGDVIEVT